MGNSIDQLSRYEYVADMLRSLTKLIDTTAPKGALKHLTKATVAIEEEISLLQCEQDDRDTDKFGDVCLPNLPDHYIVIQSAAYQPTASIWAAIEPSSAVIPD